MKDTHLSATKNINNNDCIFFPRLFIDDFRHRNITTHAKLQKKYNSKIHIITFCLTVHLLMLSRYSRCGKYINMLVYLCNTLFPMRHKISLLTIAFFFCYSVPALTVASATNQSPGGLRGRLTRPHCHLRMTSQCSGSLRGAPSGDCNIP